MVEKKEIEFSHVTCLMYKSMYSSKNKADVWIDFRWSFEGQGKKWPNKEETQWNYLVRNYLKDVFGFAEHKKMLHMT